MRLVKDVLMRQRHWLTPVLSLMLAMGSSSRVIAQSAPPASGSGDWVRPAGAAANGTAAGVGWRSSTTGIRPAGTKSVGMAQGGAVGPSHPAVPQEGYYYQRGNLPSPAISPFEHRFSRYRNDGGLWFHDLRNRPREYFGSVGYMRSKTKRPKGLVGQRGALRYKDLVLPIFVETLGLDDLADNFQGDAPSFFQSSENPAANGFGFWPPQGARGFNYFNRQTANEVNEITTNGVRVRWGFTESDDTGLVLDAWWAGRDTEEFDAEDRISTRDITQPSLLFTITESDDGFFTPIAPFEFEEILQANLLNLNGLPLDDGTLRRMPDGSTTGGTTVPYDIEFRLEYESENTGTALHFLMPPIINKGILKVQPLVGARYTYLREQFSFFGHDSGLAYDNQDAGDDIFPLVKVHSIPDGVDGNDPRNGVIDDAGLPEPVNGTDEDEVRFVRLDLVMEILNQLDPTRDLFHPGRYQAFLDNEAKTHLAGPEVGLQYSLGGEKFKLRGHTKFALLANHEQLDMKGNNIGNANDIAAQVSPDPNVTRFIDGDIGLDAVPTAKPSPLLRPTPQNPRPNAFSDSEEHTHVSPLIEQSIYLDVPILHNVPVVKRMKFFEDATLTIGYTFTWINEVARPADSIRWQGNPRAGLFPSIRLKRDDWWTSSWNFSVEIPY